MNYTTTRYTFSEKRQTVWQELTRYLQKKFNITGKVLDAGCGYGDFINAIQTSEKYALDYNPEMKKFLNPDISFQSGSIAEISSLFPQRQFKFIFSSNVLEHLSRDEVTRFFKGSLELLETGGRVCILMPNYRRAYKAYFDDFTHITPISDVAIHDWLESVGFKIEFLHPGFMPFSLKDSKLPVKAWLVRLWLLSPWKPSGKQMLVVAQKV